MRNTTPDRVRLGVFELDLRAGELRQGDRRTMLQEQLLQVLLMLIEREGEIVTREELRKELWPNDTVVEFDPSINAAIKRLRQVLGDSAEEPKYIATIGRRGYRLVVPVERIATGEDDSAVSDEPRPQETPYPPPAPDAFADIPSDSSVLTGRTVSHYRVLDIIGGGGMGVVYRAEDLKLGRQVALKFLPEELAWDPVALRRFEREARTASSLDHPNICTIYEVEEHEGQPFLVMQLLEGETLRDRLAATAAKVKLIPLKELLDIGIQISDGLQAAHEKGIVHRDIKPANIFLTASGQTKILDFGLAKLATKETASDILLLGAAAGHGANTADATLTRLGIAVGTTGYMSPEQIRGEKLDARSDLFSFGMVLYEMATGQRPFTGTAAAVVHDAILNSSPVPVRELNSTLPAKFGATIDKCLKKDREQRCQSAAEVRSGLEELRMAVQNKRARRYQVIGAAILVLTLFVIGLFVKRSFGRRSSANPVLEVKALTEHGNAVVAAITLDGHYVAYVKREAGNYELRVLQMATERDVQLLPGSPLRIRSLHFSPDGNFIYFLRALEPTKDTNTSGVFRVATLGGPVTPLAEDARPIDPRGGSVTVSPDGRQIAYIAQKGEESLIVSVDPNGANRRVLARRPVAHGFWFVEWSPSPDILAAITIRESDMGLAKVTPSNGSTIDLGVSGWGAIGQPAWAPDGAMIYAPATPMGGTMMQIWAIDAATGARRPMTSSSTQFLQWSLSATAAGDLLANTSFAETTLWAMNHSGELQAIPSLRGEGADSVAWVDDRLVTGNMTEMVVHDPSGGNPTKLRSYSVIYRQLAQCGPGQAAYWAYDKQGTFIARTAVTSGLTSSLTDGPIDDQPACSADGSILVFRQCGQRPNRCSIVRKSLISGQSTILYEFDIAKESSGSRPSVSPDGSIWFVRNVDGEDSFEWMAMVPAGGGNIRKIRMPVPFGEVGPSTFGRDGKSIFYTRMEKGVHNVWSATFDGKAPRKLTSFDSERIFSIGVSTDDRLAIARGHLVSDVVLIKTVKE